MMSTVRNVLLALSSVSSLAYASPIKEELTARNDSNILCGLENPIIEALGAEKSATAFCSSYLAIATQTFSATVTATTSTSTTTTIVTGTDIITAPTSTSTVISSTTTTAVVLTTSDDTAPTAAKRGVSNKSSSVTTKASTVTTMSTKAASTTSTTSTKTIAVPTKATALPTALAVFAAPIISAACSCLSIPTPSITNTQTVTSTVSVTLSTSTFAATTTFTPVDYTSTTVTETATSTSVILKSDVLASIVAIVNQDSYQSFCSDILTYTTPLTTVYQTTTATASTTASITATVTNFATVTVTTLLGGLLKRQETAGSTPTPLATFPADYVTSACSLAVPSPSTSTISSAVTVTATQTIVQLATQTVQATATATVTCLLYPLTNSRFETGSLSPWTYYNPINGAGGSWSVAAGLDAARGAYVAQVSLLNPDTSKYGGFLGYIQQSFTTCVGKTYTLSFDYQCTVLSPGSYVYASVAGQKTTSLTCASANTWYTGSVSWTATDATATTTATVYAVQNGATQAIIQTDNIIARLNIV